MRNFLRITKTIKSTADSVKDAVEVVTSKTRNLMFYIIAAITAAVLMIILFTAVGVNMFL